MLSFSSDKPDAVQQAEAAQPVAVPVTQTPPDVFCQNVAKADATREAFDAATQARIYARSLAQCTSMGPAASR